MINTELYDEQIMNSPKYMAILYSIISQKQTLKKYEEINFSSQIKIFFTCQLYADNFIGLNHLHLILERFDMSSLATDISLIFEKNNSPETISGFLKLTRNKKNWSKLEIFSLLFKYVNCNSLNIPGRSTKACQKKINEIRRFVSFSIKKISKNFSDKYMGSISHIENTNDDDDDYDDENTQIDPFNIESIKFSYTSYQKKQKLDKITNLFQKKREWSM